MAQEAPKGHVEVVLVKGPHRAAHSQLHQTARGLRHKKPGNGERVSPKNRNKQHLLSVVPQGGQNLGIRIAQA
jgi:hypothetical protein